MSVTQQCRSQMPSVSAKPALGDSPMDQNLVLETLKLHAAAINTGLSRLHALEQQVAGQQVKFSPAASGPPATPNTVASRDWLQDALKRLGPGDENPVIYFLHIPKTSGTSFQLFLANAFGADNMAPFRAWEEVRSFSGAASNWKVWSGHFGGLLPFILPSWPRMVTILRDPVDRAVSHINQFRRKPYPDLPCKGMGVLEFCNHPKLRLALDNAQARYLASLSFAQMMRNIQNRDSYLTPVGFLGAFFSMDQQYGLLDAAIRVVSEIDMVGITEAHHQTLRLFAHKFNVPAPAEAYHAEKAKPSELKRADLSPEELECLQELTQIDQLVYDCAKKRFERECQQAKLTPPRQ